MYSGTDTLAGGFPHSEILGSKLVCQLPGAYRRLPRPSSPVIAKASTVCAYSLDHITPRSLRIICADCSLRCDIPWPTPALRRAPTLLETKPIVSRLVTSLSEFLKNATTLLPEGQDVSVPQYAHIRPLALCSRHPTGGARRDRTADPLLAKQVLSQLSYGPLS